MLLLLFLLIIIYFNLLTSLWFFFHFIQNITLKQKTLIKSLFKNLRLDVGWSLFVFFFKFSFDEGIEWKKLKLKKSDSNTTLGDFSVHK